MFKKLDFYSKDTMGHLRSLSKAVEDSLRRNSFADGLIQMYRFLKLDPNSTPMSDKYYVVSVGEGLNRGDRVYPIGIRPGEMAEPEERNRVLKGG
jgi:hypothetical protein